MDRGGLKAALEAVLFVSPDSLDTEELARAVGCRAEEAEGLLQELAVELQGRGVRLFRAGGRWFLATAPELGDLVERFLGAGRPARLSRAAMETLALVAYLQPVTRAQVEAIRGVDSWGVIQSLMERGLVEEVGRANGPGRPLLFGTTEAFLLHFGISGIEELPQLEELRELYRELTGRDE
jgi:segregation and condensation protein B